MNREQIIRRVRRLDREQLLALQRLLDQLEARRENQKPGKEQDPEETGSAK